MAFTKYVKRDAKAKKGTTAKEKVVSISPKGIIGLGTAVVELYFKGKKHVELYYEAKKHKIGLKPLAKKTTDSLSIRYDKTGRIGQIVAQGFLKRFQIKISSSIRMPARWIGRAKLLSVSMPSGNISAKKKRTGKKKQK